MNKITNSVTSTIKNSIKEDIHNSITKYQINTLFNTKLVQQSVKSYDVKAIRNITQFSNILILVD